MFIIIIIIILQYIAGVQSLISTNAMVYDEGTYNDTAAMCMRADGGNANTQSIDSLGGRIVHVFHVLNVVCAIVAVNASANEQRTLADTPAAEPSARTGTRRPSVVITDPR